ncbi:hypothetical protein BJF79_38975 [Actinomadura sp. CNU-125]|nr:hypothetical protein BJF79_38975 [Actinomadura sp. CNU-125]
MDGFAARSAPAAARTALLMEISPRMPGAATMSPARKTPSPRSIAGRSRHVRPGRSSAPVRPRAVAVRDQVVRSRWPGRAASASASSRRAAPALPPAPSPLPSASAFAPIGMPSWNSCSPAGTVLGSCIEYDSWKPPPSRSNTMNASRGSSRTARSSIA